MKKKLHTGKPKIPLKALFIARQLLHDMILRLEFGISLLYLLLLLLLPRPPSPTITLALTPSSIPHNNSFPTQNPKKTAALNIHKSSRLRLHPLENPRHTKLPAIMNSGAHRRITTTRDTKLRRGIKLSTQIPT
jgi:hypothetical protein